MQKRAKSGASHVQTKLINSFTSCSTTAATQWHRYYTLPWNRKGYHERDKKERTDAPSNLRAIWSDLNLKNQLILSATSAGCRSVQLHQCHKHLLLQSRKRFDHMRNAKGQQPQIRSRAHALIVSEDESITSAARRYYFFLLLSRRLEISSPHNSENNRTHTLNAH